MVIKTLKNLSVPEEAGCVFTLPEFESWQSLLDENKRSLSAVNNRNAARSELVNIAAEYTHRMGFTVSRLKNEVDIIVTGHQANWHHCGIFAKNIITAGFARQPRGIAVQLVLDHDICDTSMSLPESGDDGSLRFKTILLEEKQQSIPLESRPATSKEQLRKFIDSVLQISKESFCSDIWRGNLHCIIENTTSCKTAADLITQLQGLLNRALGLEMIYLPVSLMSQSDSFIDFVCSIVCEAARFAGIYNKAIKDKRRTDDLKPNQTVRTLKTNHLNNIIELPFWLVSKTGKRSSLYVSPRDKKPQLLEILRKNECVIRPKAVMLTLFARLYLADLFVHGTGAGNYEYITDHLIRDFYKITRSNFAVATASMTLPIDAENQNSKISKEIVNYREFFFGLFPGQRLEKLADFKEVENEDSFNLCPSS